MARLPDEIDVAVIGGGAAGIAAARTLIAAGRSALILEAADRPGGRAWTVEIAGMPLDLGCGWLHSAERNPMVGVAGALGFAVDRSPSAWRAQYRALGFSKAEQQDAAAAFEAFTQRLRDDPPRSDRAADALLPGCRWNGWLEAVSSFINGAGLGQVSVADYLAYDEAASETNWRLPRGYGALVGAAARGLPIALGARVTAVDHRGPLLRLVTAGGTIAARAAIVAVPSGVLARGDIAFAPALDGWLDAASQLPLGLADKLFLHLAGPEEIAPDSHLIGSPDRADTGSYYLRPFGRPVIECFFGGACAAALEQAGEAAALAFAQDELAALLGSGIRRRLSPLAASAWARHPTIAGSYSHALPGHAEARARLRAPAADGRIRFAGEACSAQDFSTAHGAWASGIAAAGALLEGLPG